MTSDQQPADESQPGLISVDDRQPALNANEPRPLDHQAQTRDQGMQIFSYLLAGMIGYGGLGWVLDRVFNTNWLIMVGFLVGTVLSMYSIIKKFGSAR